MGTIETLMANGRILYLGFVIGGGVLLLGIVVSCFGESAKWLFNLTKAAVYGFLAYVIYYYTKEIQAEVSVLTVFSFILSCVECADNICDLFQGAIQIFRGIIDD